jgi:hypothetical protein
MQVLTTDEEKRRENIVLTSKCIVSFNYHSCVCVSACVNIYEPIEFMLVSVHPY